MTNELRKVIFMRNDGYIYEKRTANNLCDNRRIMNYLLKHLKNSGTFAVFFFKLTHTKYMQKHQICKLIGYIYDSFYFTAYDVVNYILGNSNNIC